MRASQAFTVASLAILGACLLPQGARAATFSVSAKPGLSPAWLSTTTNFVTSCPSGSVSVTANVPAGKALKVDGRTAKAGRKTTFTVKLKAGQRFRITVGSGSSASTQNVRCTPADFPTMSATGSLPSSTPFLGVSIPVVVGTPIPYAIVVDSRGVPVWWKRSAPLPSRANPAIPQDTSVLDVRPAPNGRVGFWSGDLSDEMDIRGSMGVYRLDGTKERSIATTAQPNSDAHESLPTVRGTWYRAYVVKREHVDMSPYLGPADGTVGDMVIEEIDQSGSVVWSWKTRDHLDLSETGRWFNVLNAFNAHDPTVTYDTIHLNSMEEDGTGGLIVSLRHLDAVIRIDKATGEVTWKLGGVATSKSLTAVGDTPHAGGPLSGQHDARILADGTLTVFDNGSGYSGRAPRATRWRIDPTAGTATLLEEVKDPEINSSAGGGSARKLANGAWLICWTHNPWIRAYDSTGKRIFNMNIRLRSYRAAPIPAGQFTLAQLVAGMDSQAPR